MAVSEVIKRFFKLDRAEAEGGVSHLIQSPEAAALAGQIVEEFHRRVDERRPFELQWRVNQNFVAGNQYCDIFPDTVDVENIPTVHQAEFQTVYNQLSPILNTRLSKLSRVHPGMVVRPMTSDTRDVMTAKVSTRIVKATYADQKMVAKGKDFNVWSEQLGGVLAKNIWDPRAGMCVGHHNGKPIYEGDLETLVVPYYEFFPSSCYETDLQAMDSIIHAKVYSVNEIQNRWGIRVPGHEINVYAVNTTGVVAGGAGFINSMPTIEEATMRNSEMVLEYYERPNATFPDGRHAIVVGEYLVHLGPLEFRVGKYGRRGYPFTHQRCLKWPGVFWGTSILPDLIPLQRDYNATHNMRKEYMARMGIGNLAVEDGSLEDDSILDDGLVPGQVVLYKQGAQPPKWLVPEEVPQSLNEQVGILRQEFIGISGVSEMSKSSQTPAAISSGNALEVLKEQDDTRLALTADNIHEFMQDTGQQWLRLFKQFATSLRLSRISGEETSDVFVFVWDQNTITSDDVVINTANEMLNTPAQRRQHALELYQAGFFNDPDTGRPTREGRAKVLEIYELGGNYESMIDVDESQIANAQRENMESIALKAPAIKPYDNNSLHYIEHMRFILGAEYKDLVESHPREAQQLLEHMLQHREAAVQEALAISGQGAPGLVAKGNPIDTAVAAEQQQIGSMGAGQ